LIFERGVPVEGITELLTVKSDVPALCNHNIRRNSYWTTHRQSNGVKSELCMEMAQALLGWGLHYARERNILHCILL